MITKEQTNISKGIAIMLVLLAHITSKLLPSAFARLFTPLGGIGVAIFLLLSGYGLRESQKKIGVENFWMKRFTAVILPYTVVFILFYFVSENEYSLGGFALKYLTVSKPNTFFWYVGYQIVWYFVFYCAVRLCEKEKNQYIVMLCAVVLSFFLFDEIRMEQSLSFLTGVVLSDSKNNSNISHKGRLSTVLFCVGSLSLLAKQFPAVRALPSYAMGLLQLLIKLPLGLCVILIVYILDVKTRENAWVKRATISFGKNSYAIYLTHTITILVFEQHYNRIVLLTAFAVLTFCGTWLISKMNLAISKSVARVYANTEHK